MPVRKYELMVILDPARGEEVQTETLNQIDEVITKYGGTPEGHEIIGKRRLTFSIQKRRDGYYAVVRFACETTSEVLSEVDRHCKYADDILRHITTSAVEGKKKGDPALAEAAIARQQAQSFNRGPGRGRRPEGEYSRGPAPSAAPAEGGVAVAPEAPVAEAPAAEAPVAEVTPEAPSE